MQLDLKKKYIALGCIFILGIAASLSMKQFGWSIENLSNYIGNNMYMTIGVFLILFSIRMYLFIPSTVIIVSLGIITQDIFLTFVVSMIGVIIGLIQTYYIGYFLSKGIGENSDIKQKITSQVEKVKKGGFNYIVFGCFFPVFPTDILSYAVGFIKYDFKKYLLAAILGESILVLLYSILGKSTEKYFIPLCIISIILMMTYYGYCYYKKEKFIAN